MKKKDCEGAALNDWTESRLLDDSGAFKALNFVSKTARQRVLGWRLFSHPLAVGSNAGALAGEALSSARERGDQKSRAGISARERGDQEVAGESRQPGTLSVRLERATKRITLLVRNFAGSLA